MTGRNMALAATLAIAGGAGLGGGAAWSVTQFLPQSGQAAVPPAPVFVNSGPILAPLVFPDGRLAGYASFDVQLEVGTDRQAFVAARLPLLLHAINMRTFRTPMTSGPDGLIPDLSAFRTVLMASAAEAFGAGVVRRAAIVQATPA